MTRLLASLFCGVLLYASWPAAQAPTADPISGNWGRDGMTYLELKFDGKRSVTGTTIWRSGPDSPERRNPIKTGTFDPKSGALKLEGEGERPDGSSAAYVIEGTLEKDTLSGTFQFGDRNGAFSFTRKGAQPQEKKA
jgi:hypothetical protein